VTAAAIQAGQRRAGVYALLAEGAAVARRAHALESDRQQAAGGAVLTRQGEAVVHAKNLQVRVHLYNKRNQ
jgi:hypothetical protein